MFTLVAGALPTQSQVNLLNPADRGELYAAVLKGPSPAERAQSDHISEQISRELGLVLANLPTASLDLPSREGPSCHRSLEQ
jgi:hypothetical protein